MVVSGTCQRALRMYPPPPALSYRRQPQTPHRPPTSSHHANTQTPHLHTISTYLPTTSTAMATALVIPEGGTVVDAFSRSFTDVHVDPENENAISTTEFLEAAEQLTRIFGMALPLASLACTEPNSHVVLGL